MALSTTEVEQFTKDRVAESRRDKAEDFAAKRSSEDQQAWQQFLNAHSGQRGLTNDQGVHQVSADLNGKRSASNERSNTYWACDANNGLMEEWVRSHYDDKQITIHSLTSAFNALRAQNQLATLPVEEYQRQTNTQESRVFKQRKNPAQPLPVTLNFTRAELLRMKRDEFRKLVRFPGGQIRPGVQEAVDAILAGR